MSLEYRNCGDSSLKQQLYTQTVKKVCLAETQPYNVGCLFLVFIDLLSQTKDTLLSQVSHQGISWLFNFLLFNCFLAVSHLRGNKINLMKMFLVSALALLHTFLQRYRLLLHTYIHTSDVGALTYFNITFIHKIVPCLGIIFLFMNNQSL